jgi:hypothetical protein
VNVKKSNNEFLSNASFPTQSGFTHGLSYSQLFNSRLCAFIEANYFSYGKLSASGASGGTIFSVNPKSVFT